jgi:hypothetical protein
MAQKVGSVRHHTEVDRSPPVEGLGDVLRRPVDEEISTFVNVRNRLDGCAPTSSAKFLENLGVLWSPFCYLNGRGVAVST